jgi:hypothetical protein
MGTPASDSSKALIQLLTEAATDPQRRDEILAGRGMPSELSAKDASALTSRDSGQIRNSLGVSGDGAKSIVFDL